MRACQKKENKLFLIYSLDNLLKKRYNKITKKQRRERKRNYA